MGWPMGWTIPAEWRGKAYDAPLLDVTPRMAGEARVYVKGHRASSLSDDESWSDGPVHPTVNGFDQGDSRAVARALGQQAGTVLSNRDGGQRTTDLNTTLVGSLDQMRGGPDDNAAQAGHIVSDGLDSGRYLPDGLDSGRYRCCGNGVVAPVATWVGLRLADYLNGTSA